MTGPVPDLADLPDGITGLRCVDHIAVATRSIADAHRLYGGVLGGRFMNGGDYAGTGIRTLQLRLAGGMKVELLQPTDPSSYLAAYLEKRGEGLHHVTLLFDDVERAIGAFSSQGYELVDVDLRRPAWREAYVRPRSAFGTLLQLVDSTVRWDVPVPGITAQQVLAGDVVWDEETELPRLRGG
ncbi:VOC family protein [Pseudonocardia broussonetiae]|uniref:Glyoxalase n=1 Tax=Pseudonocardia broussonetiae TaxID=2736640 RepID=A0A6M6JBX2_9PSEU|nr:VOC family protein [Pseudonocardia broussonetiae]QJY45434.1 glyoxalase [Pseudonocardia broussonetiae]